jgi:hypothetical protein
MIVGRTTHTGGMSPPDTHEARAIIDPDIKELKLPVHGSMSDDELLNEIESHISECSGEDRAGRATSYSFHTLRILVTCKMGSRAIEVDDSLMPTVFTHKFDLEDYGEVEVDVELQSFERGGNPRDGHWLSAVYIAEPMV